MNAVVEKPRVAKPAKARAQSKAKAPSTIDAAPSAEWSFMEGKALAALMIRESGFRVGGELADLNASYRDPGQPQDNFTRRFIELVMREPQLLEGFSAALSSMLAEGLAPGLVNLAHQVDCTAKINYSACTTYRDHEEYEDFNSHSEPPLDEQLAKFALEDLATVAPPTEREAPEETAEEARAPAPSEFHRLSVDAISLAETKVSQAMHLMRLIEDDFQNSCAFGLTRLMGTLPPEIKQMLGREDMGNDITGTLSDLSCALLETMEVFIAVNEREDDLSLHAVISLLKMAKDIVDDANNEGTLLRHQARGTA